MPEVIIVKDQDEAGELYARCVADLIKGKPDAVLGLATGSSPLAAYRHLAAMVKAEDIDVSKVRGFALDEYIGLPLTHPESYHSTIHRTVVEPLGLDPEKVHVPGDVLDGAPLEDGERIAHAGKGDEAFELMIAIGTAAEHAQIEIDLGAGARRQRQSHDVRPAARRRQPPSFLVSSTAFAEGSSRPRSILRRIFSKSSGSGLRSRAWFHWNLASSWRPVRQ